MFAVQSEIATAIVGALDPEIKADIRQRIRARPTESIGAYDAFLAGRSHIRAQTRRGNLEAERLFERTLGLDPDYAPALAMLGQTYLNRYLWCWTLDRSEIPRAIELFHRALALDPSLADAHYGLGWAESLLGRAAQATPHIERAVEFRSAAARLERKPGHVGPAAGRAAHAAGRTALEPAAASRRGLGGGSRLVSSRRGKRPSSFARPTPKRSPRCCGSPRSTKEPGATSRRRRSWPRCWQ